MSRSELATAVNAHLHANQILNADVDASYVGKLEAGKHRWPRDQHRRQAFRAVLGVTDDAEIGFYAARRSRADAEAATFDTRPPAVSRPDADTGWRRRDHSISWSPSIWRRMLDGLTATGIMHGYDGLYPIALEQLRRLDLVRQSTPGSRSNLARVDARWSEFMSWICDNDGTAEGGHWLSRAHTRAVEADAPQIVAYVLMRQSQRALDDGNVRVAVTLACQALRCEPLPPKTHALCLTRLAEGLALSGNDESLTLISAAGQRAESASDNPDDAIAQHCDHRYVNATHARCRYLLGDHLSASRILEEILSGDSPASSLDTGMWLTYLADSYRLVDPERAADTGSKALTVARRCGSARIVRALLPLTITLRPHQRLEPVRAFLTAHREAFTGVLTG